MSEFRGTHAEAIAAAVETIALSGINYNNGFATEAMMKRQQYLYSVSRDEIMDAMILHPRYRFTRYAAGYTVERREQQNEPRKA